MNQIIKIDTATVGGEKIQTCNARELHAFLEVKTRFNDWIARRIEDGGFVENVDYVKIVEKSHCSNLSKTQGGRPSVDYFVSLSMAKELAMLERNAKGKEARLYFIECERVAKETTAKLAAQLPNFEDPAEAAIAWAKEYRAKKELEAQVVANAPKVAFAEDVQATAKEETITGAAKILGIKPRAFFDWLRAKGYVYKQSTQATAKSIDAGLMVVRFVAIKHDDDEIEKKAYAHVTGKGLYRFYEKLLSEGRIERNDQLELTAA